MEALLKVIELLSVQQINTRKINSNTEKIITVKEIGKSKKNHEQNYRIQLSNESETFPIEEYQDKPEPTDEENSLLPSFDHDASKRRQKKQSTKHHKQPEAYNTNNQYQEPLEQNNALIVPVIEHMRKQPRLERKFASSAIAT